MSKKIILLLMVVTILCLGTNVFATVDLNTNLVSYWKLDEASGTTVTDVLGKNNGTNSGTLVNQTGKINTAYAFDNTSDKVSFSFSQGNAAHSWNVWVYVKTITKDGTQFTWSRNTTRSIGLNYKYYNDTNLCPNAEVGAYTLSSICYEANTWTMLTYTWDGTTDVNSVKVYVNGVLGGQGTPGTSGGSTASNYGWGAHASVGNIAENMAFDEVGYWSKALTSDEVIALYNSGNGLSYPFDSNTSKSRITWNVYRTGTSTHLTGVSADCNVNAMDFTTQNSPITGAYVDTNTNYSCVFSRTGYTDSSAQTGIVDANKTVTVYLIDSTNPSVGQTYANGFGISGSYIAGSGIISATASDTGSGIASCQYTIDNGSNWLSADLNATHCYKSYTIPSDGTYQFNLRATDNSSNVGTGTATIEYTVDTVSPETSFSYSLISGTEQEITLTCTDGGSGCKYINFKINNGDWNYYTIGDNPLSIIYDGAGDNNIQYFSTDNVDNNEAINTDYFTTYGLINFTFYDENSASLLNDVVWTVSPDINGISGGTLTDSNVLLINLNGITNTEYLFTFSKTGYGTRYYQTDLNHFSDININFALLPTTLGTNLNFQIRTPTVKKLVINTPITITKGNYVINKYKTDSEGYVVINLNPDQNQARYGLNFTFESTTYDWNGTTVTINVPKKETSPTTTITPFEIIINGVANYVLENKTTTQTIVLWSDLRIQDSYVIKIGDWNDTIYADRVYTKAYSGLITSDTIQPYLLTTTEASAIKINVQDEYRANIPDVTVEMYKIIEGTEQLMSSVITDITGIGLFWLVPGDQYGLKVYYDEQLIYETKNYVVTSETFYLYLNLQTYSIIEISFDPVNISWTPFIDYIQPTVWTIKFDINGETVESYLIKAYYYEKNRTTNPRIYFYTSTSFVCNKNCSKTIDINDLNIPTTETDTFYIELEITTTSGITYKTKRYYKPNSPSMNPLILFTNARADFACSTTDPFAPCPLTMLAAIIIAVIIIGGFVLNFGVVNPAGIMIMFLAILGAFTIVNWFYIPLFILFAIIGFFVISRSVQQ